jgi:ribose transport system ATP-binding protein
MHFIVASSSIRRRVSHATADGEEDTRGAAGLDTGDLLCLNDITMTFPGVVALDAVSFGLRRGEVHAVCGENGAGKSTLMKVLSGQHRPAAGAIVYKGEHRTFASAMEAQRAGIAMIHQELNLVPHLTVAENIYLAREPRKGWLVDRVRLERDAQRHLDRLGLHVPPSATVGQLPVAQQQMVEIAKALSLDAEVLIMDEPTSSLTEAETAHLFEIILELRDAGVAIVYISHRLDELARIVDRVTILRDGRFVATHRLADTSVDEIVAQMVGRPLHDKFPQRRSRPSAEVLLSVDGIVRRPGFGPVTFDVRRGEILGFAGLLGAGRTETARAVFGADPIDAGTVTMGGAPLAIATPMDAIAHGIAYLPEDRKAHGLMLEMNVAHNVTMARLEAVSNRWGFVRAEAEQIAARRFVGELDIRTPSLLQLARLLSGGNQQKIVVAKWLFRESRVIFFDEPTRGIDVGAKFAIHRLMDELAARGIGIVMISSELPEIMGMTDRIAVFHEGRIAALLDTRSTTQEEVMHFASGRRRPPGSPT